jgi:hypothetical protein
LAALSDCCHSWRATKNCSSFMSSEIRTVIDVSLRFTESNVRHPRRMRNRAAHDCICVARGHHGPPPGGRVGACAGRGRYVGPCWPRSQRSPPMTSSSCSRGIWPTAPSSVAIGDVEAGDAVVDGLAAGEGGAGENPAVGRLVGSSAPRIARQAIAPAERASALASCASALRIVVISSSRRFALSELLGLSEVSVMAGPFK